MLVEPVRIGRDKRIAVIIGGLFSAWPVYRPFKQTLITEAGLPTYIVPIVTTDWARASVSRFGPLLRLLAHTVDRAVAESGADRVTLVAHSLGGVLARLYVGAAIQTPTSVRPYLDMRFDGPALGRVDELITLGTPHISSREDFIGFGALAFANRYYPGAYNPAVRYTAVAGKLIKGDRHGSFVQRRVFTTYRGIYGQGDVWGDETIPVDSALLPGATHHLLPNVRHAPTLGIQSALWYGNPAIIGQWWPRPLQQIIAVAS